MPFVKKFQINLPFAFDERNVRKNKRLPAPAFQKRTLRGQCPVRTAFRKESGKHFDLLRNVNPETPEPLMQSAGFIQRKTQLLAAQLQIAREFPFRQLENRRKKRRQLKSVFRCRIQNRCGTVNLQPDLRRRGIFPFRAFGNVRKQTEKLQIFEKAPHPRTVRLLDRQIYGLREEHERLRKRDVVFPQQLFRRKVRKLHELFAIGKIRINILRKRNHRFPRFSEDIRAEIQPGI